MAMCPHCFETKQFWAARCPNCNSETTLFQQFGIHILKILIWYVIPLTVLVTCVFS